MKAAVWLLSTVLVVAGCGRDSTAAPVQTKVATDAEPVAYTYQVVNIFPHDRGAFTEGLQFVQGAMFESTGLNGRSDLRKVDLSSGRVLQLAKLSGQYFGEGL